MPKLETHLKTAGAMGALLFILYCLHIGFLPSEVALGDIIPLVLLLAQFALSLAWYVLLFALTGALLWSVAGLIFHLLLPIRLIAAVTVQLIQQRARSTANPNVLRAAWRRAARRFPVWANPMLALVGVGALFLLLHDYTRHGFGLSIPSVFQGKFGIQFSLFVVGCMYLFLVLQHFAHMYLPEYFRSRTVITSPLFWLAPGPVLANLRGAQVKAALTAAVVLVVCFPGGYSGLLRLSATSAGLRSDQATVVLQKASVYGQAFHGNVGEPCHFYRVQQTGDVAAVSGVTVLFHGIGKRSLVGLPAFPDTRRLEIRSEDLRTIDEPFGALRDNTYWFRIYSVAAIIDQVTDRSITRIALAFQEDEDLQPVLKTLGRLIPTPSTVADAMANGMFKCMFKDYPDSPEALEFAVAPVRRLGAKP